MLRQAKFTFWDSEYVQMAVMHDNRESHAVGRCRFELKVGANLFLKKGILAPDGPFMIFWNILIIAFTIWTGFSIPFESAFIKPGVSVKSLIVLNNLCDTVFIVDVVLNFRKAYYKSVGVLEVDPKKIARKYLRSWFIPDLLGSVPLDWFLGSGSHQARLFTLFRMTRMVRFGRLLKLVEYFKFTSYAGILQLYLLLFMIAHWMACM